MMNMSLRFFLFTAFLLALVHAGTRPEDTKWLQAKAKEEGVVATGTGLLYKGMTVYFQRRYMSFVDLLRLLLHELTFSLIALDRTPCWNRTYTKHRYTM